MRAPVLLVVAIVPLYAACVTAPAARSPLREELASSDRPRVEEAVTGCLKENGWKVDPIPGLMADAYVYTAGRQGGDTKVYVHGQTMTPRITGGPDDADPFWGCLARVLGAGGSAAGAGSDDAGANAAAGDAETAK